MLYVRVDAMQSFAGNFFLEYVNARRKTHKVLLSKQNVYNKYIM